MEQDVLPSSATDLTAKSQDAFATGAEEADLTFKRILVPIDFSEHSKKTMACAIRLASRDNALVQLLHVFQISDYAVTPFARRKQHTDQDKSQVDVAEQEARESLTAFEQHVLSRGIKAESYIRVGYPFDEIVAMADHFVDLIVIGSHGCSGIARLLVGSTVERVVEHAPCPVLSGEGTTNQSGIAYRLVATKWRLILLDHSYVQTQLKKAKIL